MQSLLSGERRVLIEGGGGDARYVATGHLLHVLDRTVLATRETGSDTGNAVARAVAGDGVSRGEWGTLPGRSVAGV